MQKAKLFRQSIVDYFSILTLWVGFFMTAPLAFVGPSFEACQGLGSTCVTTNTTRWYWFGGFHALFGPGELQHPAIIKYWPTSTWEVWLAVIASLVIAIFLYIVIPRVFHRGRYSID